MANKPRNRRGGNNKLDSRIFVLAYKHRVTSFLHQSGSKQTSFTGHAMQFTGYLEAKDHRKTLDNPEDWLIERVG